MRKLMWFAIGFTGACAAGTYFASGFWLLLLALLVLVGTAALCAIGSRWSKTAVLVLIGLLIGLLCLYGYDSVYLSKTRALDGQTLELNIQVSDYSYTTDFGIAADGTTELDGRSYRLRVHLDESAAVAPGDTVKGSFQLRYTGAGGEQAPTYHQGKGIFLLAYSTESPVVTRCEEIPLRYFPAVLRRQITEVLNRVFPQDAMAFARALLLGDSSLLSYQEDTAFQVSGIRHVIAVSGLHVSILFSLVYTLVGKRRGLTALVGIPVLLLFAGVAGFTPSINRACIMQGLMILAVLFNREYDPPTALSFAVLGMLAVNPLTVTSVSFQLSAGCMVGIFLFSGRISGYLLNEKRFGPAKGKSLRARLTRWIVGSVSVTLSAMITTVPLCAWYFDAVSLVGVLTNLLTLWVVSFVFYGIIAACLLGTVWLPVGQAVAWCVAWPIRYVLLVAKALAAFPLAAVYTGSVYIVAWIIFCYVLLVAFLYSKQKHPVVFACCLAVTLGLCVAASWAEPLFDDYRMTVLDVGQGQSILLQYRGQHYLVDCGGDTDEAAADAVAEQLLSQFVNRLNGVILTHYDRDHAGGLSLLLTRIGADRLYLPDVPDSSGIRGELEEQYGDRIVWVQPASVVCFETMKLTLFAAEAGNTDNESGLCVLFQPEKCDILITGDRNISGEKALIAQTELPELEILAVGHHGAKNAAGFELLKQTSPAVAVISVGQPNAYGHPSQDVLDRLALFGCVIYRTDRDGTIIFRG